MKKTRLKHIANITAGQSPKSTEITHAAEGLPFLQGCAEFGEKFPMTEKYCLNPPKVAQKDSWLISVRAPVGTLNLADQEYCIGRGLAAVYPNGVHQGYLGYVLSTSNGFFNRISTGSTFQAISTFQLMNLAVALAPLETQRRIAQFLDEKTARIDELIKKKRALLDRLAEKRQALITHAVTKGLNPDAPMKPSGIDWLGDIPAHWEIRGLTKCTNRIDYRGATPEKSSSGVFLVTAKNIKNGQIDYEASREYIQEETYEYVMRRGKPKLGEVLFTTEAPLGEVARINHTDIALAQRIIKFSTTLENLTNDYLAYWMYSSAFRADVIRRATGSTALGIKASKIVELRCLLPPKHEQAEIYRFLDCDAATRNDAVSEIKASVERLVEYRSALITAAVTGQLTELQ